MAILRWGIGGVLVALFLLTFAVPEQFRQPGKAALQRRVQTSDPKGRRVYTNDDFPSNRPSPSASSAVTDSGAPPPSGAAHEGEKLAPFVPPPMPIVEKMLEVARVTRDDLVYDLGSGDGRIVILAAQKYGARAVGVELDRRLARDSEEKVKELKLESLVTILQANFMQTDIKPATVVALYLFPSTNEKLRPILEKELKPGTRIVAHDMRMPGWQSSHEEAVTIGAGTHHVYLYRVPEAFRRQ